MRSRERGEVHMGTLASPLHLSPRLVVGDGEGGGWPPRGCEDGKRFNCRLKDRTVRAQISAIAPPVVQRVPYVTSNQWTSLNPWKLATSGPTSRSAGRKSKPPHVYCCYARQSTGRNDERRTVSKPHTPTHT